MFHSSSIVGCPSSLTYCVATCPFANSLSTHSFGATNRPSPWEAGLQYTPPSLAPESHGDLFVTTFVYAILLICRPTVLYVKVGESSFCSTIFPYGTRPSFTSAWNPLQMPSISPSRSVSSFCTASVRRALRNAVAKNFADPSGSSPAENPPGNIMICDCPIAFSNASTDSRISSALKFWNTLTITSAPAASNALALSYSQFVPGKTGRNTVGLATLCLQTYTLPASYSPVPTVSPPFVARVGKTASSVPVQAASASSMETCICPQTNERDSCTAPTASAAPKSPASAKAAVTSPSLPAETSATISPKPGANSVPSVTSSPSVTPS